MTELEAAGHDPAMIQSRWQKEHGCGSQVDPSSNSDPSCPSSELQFPICVGG